MTAKNKGRPLPPLLPLEYCTVARATGLLGCEQSDLLHWADVGAIDLYLMADGRYAEISPLNEFLEIVQYGLRPDATIPGDSVSVYRAGKYLEAIIGHDTADVRLTGLCRLHRTNLDTWLYYSIDTPVKEWICILDELPLPGKFLLWHNQDIKLDALYVVKSDLVKLHESITSGAPLSTRFDDEQISKRDALERSKIESQRPERLTGGISKAVYALTELALKLAGENAELINNPHKLHSKINELMLTNKANPDGGHSIGITDNAYRDIIAKARSVQPNGGN